MNKRRLSLLLGALVTGFILFFTACKKINASTDLGSGLIPAVDNITTFDTTLDVQVFNDTFGLATDSLRFAGADEAFLGRINNDPIFGKTDARLFFELKPPAYKFYLLNRPDSLYLDSVVLVLNYIETYGDTTIPQTVNVYEIDQTSPFNIDSFYLIRRNDFTYSNLLGTKTFLPSSLDDSVFARTDTTKNQLRIKLNNSFGNMLLSLDSTGTSGGFSSDSAFRTKFKGFALQSMNSGNAVMGFDLNGENTKLALYYRYNNKNPSKLDTGVTYLDFTSTSGSANYVKRDFSGTQLEASVGGASPDEYVYLQSTPGSFATVKIPGLAGLSNRLVHRAELIAEQVYDPSNAIFPAPERLYLDAFDTVYQKYRSIPFDLVYNPSDGSVNFGSFGAEPSNSLDPFGNIIKVWRFNISRYVQHRLTQTVPLYTFRMYSPFIVTNLYGTPPGADLTTGFLGNSSIVKGRVKLAGGTPGPQRMRLRIIYSKL
ncbi:MAG: DUF4270 family protein [Bacteroidota bacterium]